MGKAEGYGKAAWIKTNHMDLDLLNVSDGFLWILMDSYGFLWVHGPWGYRHVS